MVLLLFSLAMFVSATLLFLVQPMFTKMVLPLLGGTPAVWNTCMVFYQAVLLAGYAYAHTATRWLGERRQVVLHLALLLLIVFTLPIAIPHGWTPPATGNPISWLLLLLVVSVGLPFFVISTTAPMLQKWFARTGHRSAHDPYFLYGASNLGSMLALLGYPVLVEPYLRLHHQTWVWMGGYVVLMGLIGVCATMLWRSPVAGAPESASAPPAPPPDFVSYDAAPVTMARRVWWVLLAFAPSSLLLGVTSYISTDIASVPLMWVVPLAMYLLTFVLIFARKPIIPHWLMVRAEPLCIIPVAILFFLGLKTGAWQVFPLHLLAFFLIAMVCHGELMKSRPGPQHLTEFYLWMSFGGVLGGLFNALVAPTVFNAVIEYPLIIVVACLLRPAPPEQDRQGGHLLDYLLPLGLLAVISGLVALLPAGATTTGQKIRLGGIMVISILGGVVCFSFRERPRRFGLGVGAIMLAGMFLSIDQSRVLDLERNFFGILKVKQDAAGGYHVLTHGTTIHGSQSLDPARRREPLTYYHPTGPLGQVYAAYNQADAFRRIAAVGLGTGAIAAYGLPGQEITFYEIDPAVARIARDPRFFTYLHDSPAKIDVVLGDARLSLQDAPDSHFDFMVLDAFSSDAIPIHLVTREALDLYLAKLNQGGILAFHISNRFLDLKPVMGNLAQDAGLACLVREDLKISKEEKQAWKNASTWVVMARRQEDLAKLAADPRWRQLPGTPGMARWSDDFSNILEVFKWHAFEPEASFGSLPTHQSDDGNRQGSPGKRREAGK